MNETALIIALVVVVAVAVGAWVLMRQRRRTAMRSDYGGEYHRSVERYGSSSKAEDEFLRRETEARKLDVRDLSPAQRDRFSQEWRVVQKDFVDQPKQAIAEADRLVTELMEARGYPVHDELQKLSDVRVAHPEVLSDYRAARNIAEANEGGRASTEDLRQAMMHYRNLFGRLLKEEGRRH